jgi:hypothetical protein
VQIHPRFDEAQDFLGVHAAQLGRRVHRRGDGAVWSKDELAGLHVVDTLAHAGPATENRGDLQRDTVCYRERQVVLCVQMSGLRVAFRVAGEDFDAEFRELGIGCFHLD